MQKTTIFLALMAVAFLVIPQLGFSQEATVLELNKNVAKLRRVTADLEKLLDRQFEKLKRDESWSGDDIEEFILQRLDIAKVHRSFEIIIYSTVALDGWLIGCECVKATEKKRWYQNTRDVTHGAINSIEFEKRKISRIRPKITNKAALISIEMGINATNIILSLLRKVEKEISQSL
jgi:hypothetical protein